MRYIHFGTELLNKDHIYFQRTVRKEDIDEVCSKALGINKPNGLWASRYIENQQYRSNWEEFLQYVPGYEEDEDSFDLGKNKKKNIVFKINDNARVLNINNEEDIKNLSTEYFILKEIDPEYESIGRIHDVYAKSVLDVLKSKGYKVDDSVCMSDILDELNIEYKKKVSAKKNTRVYFDYNRISMDYDAMYVSQEAVYGMPEIFYGWEVDSCIVFNLYKIEEAYL